MASVSCSPALGDRRHMYIPTPPAPSPSATPLGSPQTDDPPGMLHPARRRGRRSAAEDSHKVGTESISEERARTRRPTRGLTLGTFGAGARGGKRRRTRSTTFTPQTSEVGDPLSGGGGAVHAANRAGVDTDIIFASETSLPKCAPRAKTG